MSKKPAPGYPDNNPKTQFGMAKVPLQTIPPSALYHLADALGDGGAKYYPFNWRDYTISSSVYFAAAMRHLLAWWDGEEKAPDSDVHHLAHALACLALVLDAFDVGKLNDDRPPPGKFPQHAATYATNERRLKRVLKPRPHDAGRKS